MKKLLFTSIAFCALASLTGCYKEDEYREKDEITGSENQSGYYVTNFTLDGTAYAWTDGDKANGITASQDASIDAKVRKKVAGDTTITPGGDTLIHLSQTIRANYQSTFVAAKTKESIVFTLDTVSVTDNFDSAYHRPITMTVANVGPFVYGTSVQANTFYALFGRVTVPFLSSAANGVSIAFTDKDNKVWTSSTGAQTTPSFQFSIIEQGNYPNGIAYIKADLTFGCTLYNGSTSKTVSGTARLYFVNSK